MFSSSFKSAKKSAGVVKTATEAPVVMNPGAPNVAAPSTDAGRGHMHEMGTEYTINVGRDRAGTFQHDKYAETTRNTTWNKLLLKNWVMLCGSAVPCICYFYFMKPGFRPEYALLLAILPTAFQLRQYWRWATRYNSCCMRAPPLFMHDCDGFATRELNDIQPRFMWWFWLLAPFAALYASVITCFWVPHTSTDDPGFNVAFNAGKARVRSVFGFAMLTWGFSAALAAFGATHSLSNYSKSNWKDAQADFAAKHNGDGDLPNALERFSKAAAATTCRSPLMKALAAILALPIPCAGAYRLYDAFDGGIPVASGTVIILLACWSNFMCYWGCFMWMLNAILQEYMTCAIIVRSLADCTLKSKADFLGLPHIPLTTPKNIWKWYELRQLFVTKRFAAYYALCGPSISVIVFAACFYDALAVGRSLIFDGALFHPPNNINISIVGIMLTVACLVVLAKVSTIFLLQQDHVRLLDEANVSASFIAADTDTPGDPISTLLANMKNFISTEKFCPNVFGIPVKPTFFYIIVGYVTAAISALVAKYLAQVH